MKPKRDNKREALMQKVHALPECPGVYQYLNAEGTIIYVGKAKNLKRRVTSYFNKTHESRKTNALVAQIRDLQYLVVDTAENALLLENNLIKKYKPRYNILLKDDKTYPSICIKNEPYPRVVKIRQIVRDGSRYYGPYSSNYTIDTLLDLIKGLYPIRSCKLNLADEKIKQGKYRCCMEYHIRRCKAPCEGRQTREEYMKTIDEIEEIIKGNTDKICEMLKAEMRALAAELKFEQAAVLKKKYDALEAYRAKSIIANTKMNDTDVLGYIDDENAAYVTLLHISHGCIVQGYTVEYKKRMDETREEILALGVVELRERLGSRSRDVLLPFHVEHLPKELNVSVPERGEKRQLIDLARRNVMQYKADRIKQADKLNPEQRHIRLLGKIKEMLQLPSVPMHIECFDNSNISGTSPVASCVVFKGGKPARAEYRHFNIKTVVGPDDYASMKEVVGRRYTRMLNEGQKLPDLIITDGGKGQMECVREVVEDELKLSIPIAGLVKDGRHRTSELLYGFPPRVVGLKANDELYKLLAYIQEEAHRFAITFHRNKRSKAQVHSALDNIKGIGTQSKETLIKHFKSVKRIGEATEDELAAVVGMHKAKLVKTGLTGGEKRENEG